MWPESSTARQNQFLKFNDSSLSAGRVFLCRPIRSWAETIIILLQDLLAQDLVPDESTWQDLRFVHCWPFSIRKTAPVMRVVMRVAQRVWMDKIDVGSPCKQRGWVVRMESTRTQFGFWPLFNNSLTLSIPAGSNISSLYSTVVGFRITCGSSRTQTISIKRQLHL